MKIPELKGIKCKKVYFVILPLLLAACAGESEQQRVQRAKDYMSENKVDYAGIELKNILQANPQNAEARYLLGKVNMETGNFASAKKEFQRALEAGGSPETATLGKMQAMLALREYKEIIDDTTNVDAWSVAAQANRVGLKSAAALAGGDLLQARNLLVTAENVDTEAYEVLKATVLLQLIEKQNVAARETLSKALGLYPDDAALLLQKANLAINEKDTETALRIYQQIIDLNSGKIMSAETKLAHLNMLKLAISQKDYKQANKSRDVLLARNADDPEVNYLSAVVAYEEKEYEHANLYLQKILKITEDHGPTLLLSGAVNFAKKDYEQTVYFLSKYVMNYPENEAARKLLGRAYMALGQYDEAKKEFNAALNNNAGDAELIALLGISEVNRGQLQSGIAELEKALAIAPGSDSLKLQLAKAYIVDERSGNAIRLLDEMLQSEQNYYQINATKVLAYLQDQDTAMAMKTAQTMLSKSPDNPDVLSMMGNIQLVAKNDVEARKYFNKALTLNANHIGSEMNLARLDKQQGDFISAEKHYLSILGIEPENITTMKSLARLAQQQGDTKGQIKWLEAARKADEKESFSRVVLAEVYLKMGNIADTEVLVRELESIQPKAPEVLAVKGELLMAQKRYTQAESFISQFIAARPGLDVGYYLQAQNQLALGNKSGALDSMRQAYSLQPGTLRNMILLARIEQSSGNYDRALKLAEEVIKASPDSAAGYVLKGDALFTSKKSQQALASYDKAWSIVKSRDVVLRRFSATRSLSGISQAIPILTSWLEEQPEDTGVMLELAGVYLVEKQNQKAIDYLEKVVLLMPDNVMALNDLAWLYGLENNPRALILAEKAYSLQPESGGIIDTYGWILLSTNKTKEALPLLKRAAEKLPDVPEVQYHYAKALFNSGDTVTAIRMLKSLVQSAEVFEGRADAEKILKQ